MEKCLERQGILKFGHTLFHNLHFFMNICSPHEFLSARAFMGLPEKFRMTTLEQVHPRDTHSSVRHGGGEDGLCYRDPGTDAS